ncbi:MAG: phosphonate metabolism protein/1,5-bisphosphokinase (PRPP-forming) PhnN [Pseudomonadota bacterium]
MAATFFAVVGGSGVGKDTVINGAKPKLVETGAFHFPRRWITRAPDPLGENHHSVTPEMFDQMRQAGAFCLWWGAHELQYGISSQVHDQLNEGQNVIANISRNSVPEANRTFPRIEVLEITAGRELREARLKARGRENQEQIVNRSNRCVERSWAGNLTVVEIANDSTIEVAVNRFVAAVTGLSD